MYHTQIDLRIVKSARRCMKGIMLKHKCKYKEKEESRGLVWMYSSDKYYLILNVNFLTHGVVAHEVEHIRAYIVEHAGSAEVDCSYLVEYITDRIYAFLELRNVRVKSG